jgi:tetratricopeptide (TPR) repeat protein
VDAHSGFHATDVMTTPRTLQLQRRDAPVREAVAWFLAGDDAAKWIEELCRWALPQETLRLFLVPRAAEDRRAGGLLVIPPAGSVRPEQPRALALGVVAGKLFLPVDAELHPPVTPEEAGALCRAAVTLFHPGLGVVEFEADEARAMWDLLGAPRSADADWNAACASAPLDSRLVGVALAALPAMPEIFGAAQREIGSEPMAGLPPRSDEPSASPRARIGRALEKWGAGALAKLFSMVPSNSPRRTWVNNVMDWATAKLTSISQETEELRNRELHRLMDLLESDPERGLRHALPLGGKPGRGRATPASALSAREIGFDLRRLHGGQPEDPWDVPEDLRQKLIARYRELALREQQLGRWRRAAYIHAELLGDLSAAAAVLREGRHFAEAAVLYRDHLRQARVAAECFAEAGLIAEAVAIYAHERAWLELGELHRRFGDEAAAEASFRRAVEEKIAALDFVAAAALLEDRLRAPDEALALLAKGWPLSPQALRCLSAEFALLGRLGRHEAAGQRIGALRAEETPVARIGPLAEILASLHDSYPDAGVRHRAADLARVKLSRLFDGGSLDEVGTGLATLSRLAPEDRLLARDASRFLATRTAAARPPALPQPRKPGSGRVGAPQPARKFRLPRALLVLAAKRCGSSQFIAVIWQKMRVVFLRGDWSGLVQEVEAARGPWEKVVLAMDEQAGQPERVAVLVLPQVEPQDRTLAPSDVFDNALRVGVRPWLPDDTIAISLSGVLWWVLRGPPAALVLEVRTDDGKLTGSFGFPELLESAGGVIAHASLLVLRAQAWLAINEHLLLLEGGKVSRSWRCETPIVGLEASAPFLPRGAVARCERGAAVFWADHLSAEVTMQASELNCPIVTFLGNGTLVLLSSVPAFGVFDGEVIDLDRRGVHSSAKFQWPNPQPPCALIATDRPDEFAIFTRDGEVQLFRVPVVA